MSAAYRREDTVSVLIISLIEFALLVVAGVLTWRANRGISRMQPGAARVAIRIGANSVSVVVILILLVFLVFQGSN